MTAVLTSGDSPFPTVGAAMALLRLVGCVTKEDLDEAQVMCIGPDSPAAVIPKDRQWDGHLFVCKDELNALAVVEAMRLLEEELS